MQTHVLTRTLRSSHSRSIQCDADYYVNRFHESPKSNDMIVISGDDMQRGRAIRNNRV